MQNSFNHELFGERFLSIYRRFVYMNGSFRKDEIFKEFIIWFMDAKFGKNLPEFIIKSREYESCLSKLDQEALKELSSIVKELEIPKDELRRTISSICQEQYSLNLQEISLIPLYFIDRLEGLKNRNIFIKGLKPFFILKNFYDDGFDISLVRTDTKFYTLPAVERIVLFLLGYKEEQFECSPNDNDYVIYLDSDRDINDIEITQKTCVITTKAMLSSKENKPRLAKLLKGGKIHTLIELTIGSRRTAIMLLSLEKSNTITAFKIKNDNPSRNELRHLDKVYDDFYDHFVNENKQVEYKDYWYDIKDLEQVPNMTYYSLTYEIKGTKKYKSLSDNNLTTLVRGTAYTQRNFDEIEDIENGEEVHILKPTDLLNQIIYDHCLPESMKIRKGSKSFNVCQRGDVLIACKGIITKTAVVETDKQNIILSSGICAIRINNRDVLDPYFLKAWLDSNDGIMALKSIQKGNVIQVIDLSCLESLKVLVPSIDKQKKFTARYKEKLEQISSLKKSIELSLKEADDMINSL